MLACQKRNSLLHKMHKRERYFTNGSPTHFRPKKKKAMNFFNNTFVEEYAPNYAFFSQFVPHCKHSYFIHF